MGNGLEDLILYPLVNDWKRGNEHAFGERTKWISRSRRRQLRRNAAALKDTGGNISS